MSRSSWSSDGARLAAWAVLLTYLLIVVLAGLAIRRPADLGLRLAPCGDDVCVTWVMPAGQGWLDGARPGMRAVRLNGMDVRAGVPSQPLTEAEMLSSSGQILLARVMTGEITLPWARTSLWLTGALFAFLGAAVLARRPDSPVARLFALFAWLTGMALGVSPASGGPHAAWSLVVQFVSLLGTAATLPAFASAFVRDAQDPRTPSRIFPLAGGVLLAGYVIAVIFRPGLYGAVRIAFACYFAASVLTALVVLARRALRRQPRRTTRDARLALTGVACGTLPFLLLTLIPMNAPRGDFVPAYATAIVWGIIPLTFAYAILRHHVLGIRRLVHRGMVYGVTAAITLALVFLAIVAIDRRVDPSVRATHPAWLTALLVALGALLFHLLSRGARRLIDRHLYPDGIDSGTLLASMRDDLAGSGQVEGVVAAVVSRLRESLRLEAAVLFLGTTAEGMRVAASAGPRAEESILHVRHRLPGLQPGPHGQSEIRMGPDMLLVARLQTGGQTIGHLVLGPKDGGEVFLGDERRLVETVSPILALAIRETSLLAELREVSERLTDAQEAERGRIARDLHDGPLQKAILLGGVADVTLRDRNGVARELAAELRELCARLRPAILDDLGLVPALEWLLEQTAQGFVVTPRLTLRGMTEDDRLAPNVELALFRVTQEAVSNALKHGHARSIHVCLTRSLSGIELSITDDGSGAAMTGHPIGGLGIPGMRERVRQVGGSVSIFSDGRTGTMVSARIPHVAPSLQ